jgi:predicted N-acetyltransferase YhbS
MNINYSCSITPHLNDIIDLYISSGINRPVSDTARIEKMYDQSNLIITAWDGEKLVGISRSLTDFCYCCYLSDLAVNINYQHKGIGIKLIALTKEQIGEQTMLLLLSAPPAMNYYPHVGFEKAENAFIIRRNS